MKEFIKAEIDVVQELEFLRSENARLKGALDEKIHRIEEYEDQILTQGRSFATLNKYSLDLALKSEEEIYSFISHQFKSIFRVKEVWISIYDEKDKALILKGTTLSEEDNSILVRRLGRGILGFRTPVTAEDCKTMIDLGIGEPSSLYDSMVEICISDNGIGMDNDIVVNLFTQNDNTCRKGTDNEPSTGLGLMLCKDFVERHGSRINVRSEVGKGSSFSFNLNGCIKV